MSHPQIARNAAVIVGVLTCAIGVLHDVVNIRSLLRAAERGEVAARLVPQLVVNIAFAGIALALPGLVLILVARELARGKRMAARLALASGLFFVVSGVAGYLWQPIPTVLIFSALGALVCAPLLLWREEFRLD
ncbi:MAG: hypothetical protein WD825_16415 [Gemmatimonadaceae bacterium]